MVMTSAMLNSKTMEISLIGLGMGKGPNGIPVQDHD